MNENDIRRLFLKGYREALERPNLSGGVRQELYDRIIDMEGCADLDNTRLPW